jgi:signal peptidase II
VAEAERIIGTPDIPEPEGAQPDRTEPGKAELLRPEPDKADKADKAGPERPEEAAADAQQQGEADGARRRRRLAVLFAVAVLAYVLDLGSKMIVVAKLEHHDAIELVGDWLKLQALRNAGAAFGIGEAFTVIFTLIAATVIVVITRLARKLYSTPWAVALGLLLGGALGNLTDRIFRSPGFFRGEVVDFVAPKHFAVFNLADSAIVCGGILIVLLSFRGLDPDGTVHRD